MLQPFRFGEYEILGQLSKGRGASVFLARTESFEPEIAATEHRGQKQRKILCVKTLSEEWAKEQQLVEMFEDEGQLAMQLSHRNCIRTYKTGVIDEIRFITMEYLNGMSLKDIIRESVMRGVSIEQSTAAFVVARACEALDYAHNLVDVDGIPYHIVHRDICPHNLIISYNGVVKLMDFGVVKADTARIETASGVVKGRFTYMSPEHISGGSVDRRSDIFSMGILLYETLARRRFYKDSDPKAIATALYRRNLPRLAEFAPDCDLGLVEICDRATQFSRGDRYQSAAEMAAALDDFAGHQKSFLERDLSRTLRRIAGEQQIKDAGAAIRDLEQSSGPPVKSQLKRLNPKIMGEIESKFS